VSNIIRSAQEDEHHEMNNVLTTEDDLMVLDEEGTNLQSHLMHHQEIKLNSYQSN
jgi:hypothetical protein